MRVFIPDQLVGAPALVVALHGCTQTGDEYDCGTGWSTLADRHGFVVVCPQQQLSNNPKNCFSWFLPGDISRDQGEALSIRQMVDHAIAKFGVDPRKVFVTGFSSGGAMASAMLATYPDIFAAGAIVAGLPYGCAASVKEAFEVMFTEQSRCAQELGDRVRVASKHSGPWPRLSLWHGTADAIVNASNAESIIRQWTNVHALQVHPSDEEIIAGQIRRTWNDTSGNTTIEFFSIIGMPHGVPISSAMGPQSCGAPGPFFLDVGVSSTHHIVKFWGLDANSAEALQIAAATTRAPWEELAVPASRIGSVTGPNNSDDVDATHRDFDPNPVIAAAFRAAGLSAPNVPSALRSARPRVAPGPIIEAALRAAGLLRR
jgi:poly(hydroxyalkanoate) depolymerase family esterase